MALKKISAIAYRQFPLNVLKLSEILAVPSKYNSSKDILRAHITFSRFLIDCLSKPHKRSDHNSKMYPYFPVSIKEKSIYMASISGVDDDSMKEKIVMAKNLFHALPSKNIETALILLYPDLQNEKTIDHLQVAFQPSFVETSLMIQEFHKISQRGIIPALMIRHMTAEDESFLANKKYSHAISQRMLALHANQFNKTMDNATNPSKNDSIIWSDSQFHTYVNQVGKFITNYMKNLESCPVISSVKPGYLRKVMPKEPPKYPDSFDVIMNDVTTHIVPSLTQWQSPKFFGYFPSNTSYPGIIGGMLSDAFTNIGFSWVSSPASTELEMLSTDWLGRMIDLPDSFLCENGPGGGVIQPGASDGCLVTLVAARERIMRKTGAQLHQLVVYASDQAHVSIKKACMILGISINILSTKPNDWSLSLDCLTQAFQKDILDGKIPFYCCLSFGTTSSCVIDPIADLAPWLREQDIWIHVDAAYAGSAMICPEYRPLLDGIENCDSLSINPHKWLLVPNECSVMWVKDRKHLLSALSLIPSYLRNKMSDSGQVMDYKDWQLTLGRRMRSLKLWFVIRAYGVEKLREHIRRHISLAKEFEKLVIEDGRFQIINSKFGLVCFCLNGGEDVNKKLLESINESEKAFIVHAEVGGQFILRMAIGSPNTESIHVKEAWKAIKSAADNILNKI